MAIDEKVRSTVIELEELMPRLRDASALTPNVYGKLKEIFGVLGSEDSVEILDIYANHGFVGYNAIIQQAEGLLKKYESSK